MTVLHGIAALLWPVVAAYAIWTFAPVVAKFAPVHEPVQKDEEVHIPDDLIGFVAEYPESWAQEDTMRAIKEKYLEYKDWDKVRRALGLAPVK